MANKVMNTDVKICVHFYAGYGKHSSVEVSIKKYEKTAMQWLQKQTQNN